MRTGEAVQWVRATAALAKNPVLIPSTHGCGGSQPSVPPVPGGPDTSSVLHWNQAHAWFRHTHASKAL